MKLAEAEMLLEARKLEGPITEPWITYCDEGITLTALPMGMAAGSWQPFDMITLRPHYQYSALFHGSGAPHHLKVPRLAAHHLWEQEWFVYQRERQSAVVRALEQLWRVTPIPRREGHHEIDIRPFPEDFGMGFAGKPVKEVYEERRGSACPWGYGGIPNVSQMELRNIKFEFRVLLADWVETH